MQTNYLDDILNDPQLAEILRMQAQQELAQGIDRGLPAEPGVPKGAGSQLPAEPSYHDQMNRLVPPAPMDDLVQRGTPPPPEEIPNAPAGPPPPPEPMVTGERNWAGPDSALVAPVPSEVPPEADPRLLAMMSPPIPAGPQAAGMPRQIEAPDGNVLLTGPPSNGPAPAPTGSGGFKGYLKRALPNMITAGLQSLATPSHYGGGPLDIAQGVLAGQGAIDAKTDKARAEARQKTLDDLNTAHVKAEIEQAQAAARHSDASAESLKNNPKMLQTTAETEYELMNKFPPGSAGWNQHHDLWMEALHGRKPASADKVWYEVKSMPGMERNAVTGEYREAVPGAGRKMRIEEIRQQIPGYNPNIPWTDNQVVQHASSQEKFYINNGKWPAEHNTNPTEASLAVGKAQGDPIAAAAFDELKRAKPVDPLVEQARQARLDEARASQFRQIENQKEAAINKAQDYRRIALAQLSTQGKTGDSTEAQAVEANARRMQQDAYNAYTQAIRNATKNPNAAEDLVVMPDGSVVRKSALDAAGIKTGTDGTPMTPNASAYEQALQQRRAGRGGTN